MHKWFACVSNPPYQGENHQQVYPDMYLAGQQIADCVDMIFPTGWQEPKNANNLRKLNNASVKEDSEIVLIDNVHNVFDAKVAGAEWTNIILWKRGYDNGLEGKQRILTNGQDEQILHLNYDKSQIEKPAEIMALSDYVQRYGNFTSMSTITSVLKPYGLRTDVISDTDKYGLAPLQDVKLAGNDIKIYCKGDIVKWIPNDYALPKTTPAMERFKVFVPYAWGNMSEKTGLGGAYSNIIIGSPHEICTESYLESGCFDEFDIAQKHAKYLMTKFCRALLYLNKFSQHSTTAWGAIPVQDYHENFWKKSIAEIDNALMDKYSVPQNISDFVFNNIQTKTEANIVNYKETD